MTPQLSSTNNWKQEIAGLFPFLFKPRTLHPQRRPLKRAKQRFAAEISTSACSEQVRGIDIHQFGIGVISSRPFVPGDLVVVRIKCTMTMGFAYVRHCTKRRGVYNVG